MMGLKANNKVCWIPQVLFFISCICFSGFVFSNEVPGEVRALLALKSDLVDSLGKLSDWKYTVNGMSVSPCSWTGITCNNVSRVVALDLSSKNLTGTLSVSQEVQLLTHILSFSIRDNQFSGPLPEAIFRLSSLRSLDISYNYFNGSFPGGVSGLKNLVDFNAYSNNFTGPLPWEFAELANLRTLNLAGSYFDGSIPSQYGELSRLKYLSLAGNLISGPIPAELGMLRQLRHLELGSNIYMGGIPWQLGYMSKLVFMHIANANLTGPLPVELSKLKRLQTMILYNNMLTGFIPWQLSNIASMERLDLSVNMLTGPIPEELSMLKRLTLLNLMSNKLRGGIPKGIADMPRLQILYIWNNSLTGSIPEQLGKNSKLVEFDASTNQLTGPIPSDLCAGNKLERLILFSNQLTGEIPQNLTNCAPLYRVRMAHNNLSGRIPLGFGKLQNLNYMEFPWNNFSGPFPPDLLNSPSLQLLNVSHNSFQGSLPPNIWSSPSLQIFSAAFSNLSGKLPSFEHCKSIYNVELQGNSFSGCIPEDIFNCQKLLTISLSQNELYGAIPPELASIPSITNIDLSHNALTGMIPLRFQNSTTLELFNVSFNHLVGPVPSDGLFRNIPASAFVGNQGLCGGVLTESPCMNSNGLYPSSYHSHITKKTGLTWMVVVVIILVITILVTAALIIGIRCFRKHYFCFASGKGCMTKEQPENPWKMTSFLRLSFTVDDVLERLNPDNMIGTGAAGTVYRAEMPGGQVIAVKKLLRVEKESRGKRKKGVLAEVEVLGNVRHRNIVKLLGCCSNNEETLLLYEYMPNGSLADLLHGEREDNMLTEWMTRYNIAVGVAQGLCYLHQDCRPPIVHRDVKPSNILLDSDMTARVADFGVAKLIRTGSEAMSAVAGSCGYIAPEYAYTLQVFEKSDIYSFGVVLLELLTGRKPMDPEFGEGVNIVDWVKEKFQAKEGMAKILDQSVGVSSSSVQEEMMLVLRVALLCTSRSPMDRPSMRDVVAMLSEAQPKRKAVPDPQSSQQRRSSSSSQCTPPSSSKQESGR